MENTHEAIRMAFWVDIFKETYKKNVIIIAVNDADICLREFDERFSKNVEVDSVIKADHIKQMLAEGAQAAKDSRRENE